MLPFKLFQSKQNLTWLFCILRRFLIRYGQLNFWYVYPVPVGFWSDFLFTCYLVSIATLARNFIAVYTLLLCILQDFSCLDLVYVLPESKICFFWKEIDKTFCCNCFFKILKTFWNIRLKANQMSLDLRYLLFQTRRALTGYYTAHSY